MKVAFFIKNPKEKYSGGRIHGMILAMAFSKLNYKVDIYTNNIPIFYNDIIRLGIKENVRIRKCRLLLFMPIKRSYDIIVVVPHLTSKKSYLYDKLFYYNQIKIFKKINQSKLWFLDFESPNWVIPQIPQSRSEYHYVNSNKIISSTDVVLSTTKIGSSYAKAYYSSFNNNLIYKQLYLPINTYAADNVEVTDKSDSAMLIARFGESHKGSNALPIIIKSLPKGFTLNLMLSSHIDQETLNSVRDVANKFEIEIKFHTNISDLDKFKLLAKSKIFFFSSSFEGYGLPPIEAQYMNTPVICSDLPVLREVNPMAIFDDFSEEAILTEKIITTLSNNIDNCDLKDSIASKANYLTFVSNLEKLL